MWHGSERSIEPSEHTILECGGCGERLVLLGLEGDWYSEGRTVFECGRCGGRVTLANRIEEDAHVTTLLQELRFKYYQSG